MIAYRIHTFAPATVAQTATALRAYLTDPGLAKIFAHEGPPPYVDVFRPVDTRLEYAGALRVSIEQELRDRGITAQVDMIKPLTTFVPGAVLAAAAIAIALRRNATPY